MLAFDEYLPMCTLDYNKPEWARLAKIILPELIARAKRGQTWNYSDIGRWLLNEGYTTKNYITGNAATKIGRPIGLIGDYCNHFELPLLNVLVVHKDSKNRYLIPGTGVYDFINIRYKTSFVEKKDKKGRRVQPCKSEKELLTQIVKKVQKEVKKYNKWEDSWSLNDLDDVYCEGDKRLKKHFIRERDPRIVKLKKDSVQGNLVCEVCNFNFSDKYGKIGENFIECHHKIPIPQENRGDTKVEDLALVCSNCHRMIHRKKPCYTIEDIRAALQE
ncbi:MAG: HNH endonuclease [Alphaproteobacteria bacterium]|nr:HNH endonuclease [Alphaproteobacteria bacterium]